MDYRDLAAMIPSPWKIFDEKSMTLKIEYCDEEDYEVEAELPAKFEVCDTCNGRGKYVNPSIDSHGITASEWEDWDPDEKEGYFRGHYDIPCDACRGTRVIPVIDENNFTEEQREIAKQYYEQLKNQAMWAREEAYARKMGF